MLNSWPVAFAVATVLGFLAGLGVGGGSLLVLWLTLILDMSHPQARIYNLLFFIPSAIIASLFRWRSGNLSIRKVLPGVLAGCLCAAGASLLGQSMDIDLLKKLFGILLLATGIRELCYKPKRVQK
jgi:uncharacterized membrane protein YfcA